MTDLYFAGIDAGSTYVKAALIQGEKIVDTALANTGIDNSATAARLLDELATKNGKFIFQRNQKYSLSVFMRM